MQEKTLRSILMVVIFLVALVGISVTLNDRKENKPSNTNSNLERSEERRVGKECLSSCGYRGGGGG